MLDPDSNVQFGEGGAGTFSDGKLNTLVKDPNGRNHEVLKRFVEAGAPEEIVYQQKPHLGTDVLIGIVETMRHQIEEMGGSFRFETKVTDLCIENGHLTAVEVNIEGIYPCGEGAGYAGGITSAAMDGIKTAEFICEKFRNF